MIKSKKIAFYVEYPYYFTHFLAIGFEFLANDYQVEYILSENENTELMLQTAKKNKLDYSIGEINILDESIGYIVFANNYNDYKNIKAKTVFLDHGSGTKFCDYKLALHQFDLVLVEGSHRFGFVTKESPSEAHRVKQVGFSKLDLVVNFSKDDAKYYIEKYNLDSSKPTILYAPTFFPSSIENMADNFPSDFKDCNVIVKPHYFSWHRPRYKKQRLKFKKWNSFSNCSVCEPEEDSLIPFLHICDIMISDESSAIFEFAALDKPVILNKFIKLRWSYYLNPSKFTKRMNQNIAQYRTVGDNADKYADMVLMVRDNLKNKNKFQSERLRISEKICGVVDGKVSQRIFAVVTSS